MTTRRSPAGWGAGGSDNTQTNRQCNTQTNNFLWHDAFDAVEACAGGVVGMSRPVEIEYESSDGTVSRRLLVDYYYELGTFSAGVGYVNAREGEGGDMRSFRVDRIRSSCFPDTGEVVEPWLIGNPGGVVPALVALRPYAAAINQVRDFVRRTRGFRARESARFEEFVVDLLDALVQKHPERMGEFVGCAHHVQVADPEEIIAADQRMICRRHALKIAAGSGRKPVSEEIMSLINARWPL